MLNREAVNLSIRAGLALNCEIATITKWDRKSYFYPDLPKSYQISQYDQPVAQNGFFEVEVAGETKRVHIRRAHLEEDAGKNVHDTPGCTLVDLNRAGTPLLEIVTEPDIESPEQAYAFCTELQRLMVHLDISEASMQKGQMRFEPNVNVVITRDGVEYKTPIAEVKNINSFRFVRDAIAFETTRQIEAWQADNAYVLGKKPNENRGWNSDRGVSEFQRSKEGAEDYRYFPDPDLLPIEIPAETIAKLRDDLPELPVAMRKRFLNDYGLSASDAETIVSCRETAALYEKVVSGGAAADVAGKQFVNVWATLANARDVTIDQLGVSTDRLAELVQMTVDGTINKSAVTKVAEAMLDGTESPRDLAETLGLMQIRDTVATETWVDQALLENEEAVAEAISDSKKAKAAMGFLRGRVMKLAGGKADPKIVGEVLESRLKARRDLRG
jgi:aspartyl-tRNA(Asn)/glutamyl-tRNA(Gln) amidotransferase subunit B